MKIWQCPKSGVENAIIIEKEIPVPKDYEIVVKVFATGLNPVDYKRC